MQNTLIFLHGGSWRNHHSDGRALDKKEAERTVKEELTSSPIEYDLIGDGGHVYDSERCLFCNVNVYDNMIYGPYECTTREPLHYSTETPVRTYRNDY